MLNEIFKALSDPTRREILKLLREKNMSAGELADKFDLAKSTMSAHFTALKLAGLIVQEKKKTSVVYSLNISAAEETMGLIVALLQKRKKKGQ